MSYPPGQLAANTGIRSGFVGAPRQIFDGSTTPKLSDIFAKNVFVYCFRTLLGSPIFGPHAGEIWLLRAPSSTCMTFRLWSTGELTERELAAWIWRFASVPKLGNNIWLGLLPQLSMIFVRCGSYGVWWERSLVYTMHFTLWLMTSSVDWGNYERSTEGLGHFWFGLLAASWARL
jgi:hypothetical protein